MPNRVSVNLRGLSLNPRAIFIAAAVGLVALLALSVGLSLAIHAHDGELEVDGNGVRHG